MQNRKAKVILNKDFIVFVIDYLVPKYPELENQLREAVAMGASDLEGETAYIIYEMRDAMEEEDFEKLVNLDEDVKYYYDAIMNKTYRRRAFLFSSATNVNEFVKNYYATESKEEAINTLIQDWEGLGKDLSEEDVDPEQLEMGIEVEKEHTGDEDLAKMIAIDHLYEMPDYYTKLKKMEEDRE